MDWRSRYDPRSLKLVLPPAEVKGDKSLSPQSKDSIKQGQGALRGCAGSRSRMDWRSYNPTSLVSVQEENDDSDESLSPVEIKRDDPGSNSDDDALVPTLEESIRMDWEMDADSDSEASRHDSMNPSRLSDAVGGGGRRLVAALALVLLVGFAAGVAVVAALADDRSLVLVSLRAREDPWRAAAAAEAAAAQQNLLEMAERVALACDGGRPRADIAECADLCAGNMCCVQGGRPCNWGATGECAVYAGCRMLLFPA